MVVVLVTATIVTVLNNSMITVVLAAVGRDLSAAPSALGWTATGYLLPFAAGNALAGLLSDRVSLRRVFTLGLIVFVVGTVAAATAPSVNWLIIARGVQGAGGSVVPALSAVAIARVFEAGRRGPAFGRVRCSGCPPSWWCPCSSAQRGPSQPRTTQPPRQVPS